MATNKEELLEQWLVEIDPARRQSMLKELTLRGLFPDDTDFEKSYGLYPSVEDENFLMKLFHKREFSENKYESIQDLATCEGSVEFEISPVQRFVSTYLSGKTPYTSALLYQGVGVGKCHGKDTPILMYDGSIKKIQDIDVGDILMGDDSTPRNVLSLARGRDMMFEIKTVKGDSYIVNSEHILSLKYTGTDNVIDVPLDEYLRYSNKRKSNLKGYHTGVNFKSKEVTFDPYILGVWLGDGSQDSTILHYLREYTPNNNLSLNYQSKYDYRISSFSRKEENTFLTFLKKYNLINNKHIPNDYKINDKNIRLQVLAGLIDTDGYLVHGTYEITQKSKQLMDDIIFLARSLGFMTTTKHVVKSCTYKNSIVSGYYYRTFISGDISTIPVKIERKKAAIRTQKKDVLKHGFDVVALGEDDYYGFTLDGNNRYVLGNFIVTHNTCAAISVSEAFLHFNPKKKVNIIAPPNIQPNFLRTIFDINNVTIPENKELPNTHKGCTGNLYLQLSGTEYERDIKVLERKVRSLITNRYTFMGYIQLAKHIERVVSKLSSYIKDPEKRRLEEIKIIRKEFSGTCMIIDEAHNLRDIPNEKEEENLDAPGGVTELTDAQEGKKLTPSLTRLLNYAVNMKLVLLTATPMYNNYQEIIFLLNLLLQNDKRATLKVSDVFNQKGDFLPEGRTLFGKVVKAYVSFMRGETPISFPIRLNPKKAPKLDIWPSIALNNEEVGLNETEKSRLMKLPIVPVKYGEETFSTYNSIVETSVESYGLGVNSIDTIVQSGNWIYPGDDEIDIQNRIRDSGFDSTFDDRTHSIRNFTRFSSRLGQPTWLLESNLINYSPKAAFIIKNIKKTRGPVFVYSRFIKSGALPLALALEANGYTPYGRDRGLLYEGVQLESGRQCALCEEHEKTHKTSNHQFVPAKYVLLTGRKDISPNNNEAVIAERKSTNYNGADIKVIIGSQVASEGIDLKFIREIYVMDSWFHLNKMEQVLGRGIRTCSHIHPNIPKDQRNCTIYLLVNTLTANKESADMYMYRLGMMKALQMGKVSRVIKEYALDCNLNINVNIIQGLPISTQTDAQGNTYEVNINDQSYTNMCDWMECKYTCKEELNLDLDSTSTLTYDDYDARWRESQIKKVIKKLFETREEDQGFMLMRAEDLTDSLSAIPIEALYSILHDIVNNKSFRLVVNKKEGYLTYKNGFYLFQPLELESIDIPLALRIANYPVKQDEFTPIKEKMKKEEVAQPIIEEGEDKVFIQKFWQTVVLMAQKIQNGSLENRLQQSVLDILNKKYTNKSLQNTVSESLESIIWLYKSVKDNVDYRAILAYVFLDFAWDNLLNVQEQLLLSSNADDVTEKIAEENLIQNGKYFRYLNYTDPYDILYYCGNKLCFEAEKRILDKDSKDTINTLPEANITNVGPYYGFIVPKAKQLIFKTNVPAAIGSKPKGGSECRGSSGIKEHLTSLLFLGRVLRENHITDFDLNEESINPDNGKRKIKNANTYCSIKEYVLRWMDKKRVKNVRWFYRPISSFKTGHRGRVTKD